MWYKKIELVADFYKMNNSKTTQNSLNIALNTILGGNLNALLENKALNKDK
jgi:hypothetical protein